MRLHENCHMTKLFKNLKSIQLKPEWIQIYALSMKYKRKFKARVMQSYSRKTDTKAARYSHL